MNKTTLDEVCIPIGIVLVVLGGFVAGVVFLGKPVEQTFVCSRLCYDISQCLDDPDHPWYINKAERLTDGYIEFQNTCVVNGQIWVNDKGIYEVLPTTETEYLRTKAHKVYLDVRYKENKTVSDTLAQDLETRMHKRMPPAED